MSHTKLMAELEQYMEQRSAKFYEEAAKLRQELVDDLATHYRQAGIPAMFTVKGGQMTISGKTVGMDEFTEAMVSGDITAIATALVSLQVQFQAQRSINGATKNDRL